MEYGDPEEENEKEILKNLDKEMNNSIFNKLKEEQDKTENIKQNLKNKEKQILLLKKELEKLKQNNNFKDGTFFTSIGAKGKTKNDKLEDLDVNIVRKADNPAGCPLSVFCGLFR